MDFNKAIAILGLKRTFTEDELKKAYRALSHKYHPDKFEGTPQYEDMVKKQQEVNEAKDFLKDYLKSNGDNIDITAYIEQKIKEIKDITNFEFDKYNEIFSDKFKNIIDRIFSIYVSFAVTLITIDRKNKTTIDNNFNQAKQDIKERFKKLKELYYEEKNIDENDVKETINYDCTLKEFYEQLLKFKDKYSKESILKKKLEDEILKYTYFAGYEIIETQIKEIIENFANKIKKQRFKYNQQDIDDMNQEITDLFNKFFTLKQKTEILEEIVKQINDEEIKEQFELIKNNLYSGYSFDTFDEKISELEELIQTYIKETKLKTTFKENEQAINDIYKELIERYNQVAQSYNIINYPSAVEETNKQLNELLQLFITGCRQYKDLDFFNLFKEITFKSFYNDDKITRKIKNMTKDKKSKVYIKINIEGIWDECSFFWFDEENMTMYRIRNVETIDSEKINLEELTEDYIPLEEFLDEATFIGKYKMKRNTDVIGIVYEGFGYSIYLEKDKFCITKDINIMGTSNRNNEYLNRFMDKKYVCDMIEEQLREILEKHKKKSIPTGYKHYTDYIMNNNKIYRKPVYNYEDRTSTNRQRRK